MVANCPYLTSTTRDNVKFRVREQARYSFESRDLIIINLLDNLEAFAVERLGYSWEEVENLEDEEYIDCRYNYYIKNECLTRR